MRHAFPKGLTLLEMVIYIGLLTIAVPGAVAFLLRLQQSHIQSDARMRMEQTAAVVLSELQNKITAANSITTSSSTLNTTHSTLSFIDDTGTTIVIDAPSTTATFPSGTQTVRRLRVQIGASPAIYLTDPEIDVTEWRVVALRNSDGDLTGLRFNMDYAMLHADLGAYRDATFTGDTTIALQPHTIEN